MTDEERDELLLDLRDRLERIEEKQGEQGETLDAVSDGLQDLRRDLEVHAMLPPSEEPEEATG